MGRVVSATEARAHFGELMRRAVENHETIIVERRGRPRVVVISMGKYNRLQERQQRAGWEELVRRARAQIQADLGDRTLPRPEEIWEKIRVGRDQQLITLR